MSESDNDNNQSDGNSSTEDSELSPPLSPSCIIAVYERGYTSPQTIGNRRINNYKDIVTNCNQLQNDFHIDNFEHSDVESKVEQDEQDILNACSKEDSDDDENKLERQMKKDISSWGKQRLSNYYKRKRSSPNEAQTKSNNDDDNNTSPSSVEQNPVKVSKTSDAIVVQLPPI